MSKTPHSPVGLLVALVVSSCGNAPRGTPFPDAGPPPPALVTACSGTSAALPDFDRACTDDTDCALFFHQVDCCGTTAAWSYATRVGSQVLDAETMCRAMIPTCDCVAGPLRDEDGVEIGPGETVGATCRAGSCRGLHE